MICRTFDRRWPLRRGLAGNRTMSLATLIVFAGLLTSVLPTAGGDEPSAAVPLHERIDRLIESDHVGTPAPLAGDAEFLRRVYLDLMGSIPSVEETRTFLDDPSPDKRRALIDRLLADPRYARHMATVFDLALMERRSETHVKNAEWLPYLVESFRANKPLNQLAREILAADGVDESQRATARFYLDRDGEPNLLTRDVGRVFLGMDLQCAQCHNHPLIDDYLQSDYYGIYAFLSRSYLFADKKAKKSFLAEKAEGDVTFKSVFTEESGSTSPRLPGGQPIMDPTFPKGQEYLVKPDKEVRPVPKYSRRAQLAEHATSGTNQAFNRNWANRLWAQMMGRGLVDPVDLHHPANPPVHPELLQLLADELVAMKFDVREFLRQLALSRTYQRGFDLPVNLAEQAEHARPAVAALTTDHQRLMAEAEQTRQAYVQAQQARSEASKVVEELAKPMQEATAALTAAQTLQKTAVDQLAQTKAQHVSKQELAAAVATIASQTELAASKLAPDKKLAPVKDTANTELTSLLTTLRARGEKLTAELQELASAMVAQQAAVDASAVKLAEAQQVHDGIAPRHAAASQQLAELETTLEAARLASTSASDHVDLARRRIEQAERLVAFSDQAAACAAAEAELASLSVQIAMQQQVDALREQHDQVQARLEAAAASRDELLTGLTEDWGRRFVVASLKPLRPEQLAWSVMEAAGVVDRYRTAAKAELDKKQPLTEPVDAAALAERQEKIENEVHGKLAGQVGAFVKLFGAGAGQPQDDFFATVDQALFFANGGQVLGWLAPSAGNLCERLNKLETSEAIAEELYLSVLVRRPAQQEIQDVADQLAARPNEKPAVVQELVWALLTSAEFRFNH